MRDRLHQAAALFAHGDIAGAERGYRQILAEDPDNASALWGLGRVAAKVRQHEDAIRLFEQSTARLPAHPLPLIDMAKSYEELRDFKAAGRCFEKAARVSPESAYAQYCYGVFLIEDGANDEAEKHLRAAMKIEPRHAYAFYEISKLKTFKSREDADFVVMAKLAARTDLERHDQIAIFYALGKAHDDLGEVDEAFACFDKANALQHEKASFSVEQMKPFFEDIKSVFGTEYFTSAAGPADLSLTPIFIIGLPRSGTSLLEFLLGRHSEIFAAGELPFVPQDVVSALQAEAKTLFPQACKALNPDKAARLAQIYVDRAAGIAPGFKYVTDKLPANFQSIGLIRRLMPGAKIINMRRDPMDTGFSIFKNFFNENEPYFCSLKEIGDYSRLYDDLMDHWRRVAADHICDVDYEELATNTEEALRRVLNFCELEWQAACLQQSDENGHVRTLSNQQVRKDIGGGSIGAWKPYANYLGPLQRALKPPS